MFEICFFNYADLVNFLRVSIHHPTWSCIEICCIHIYLASIIGSHLGSIYTDKGTDTDTDTGHGDFKKFMIQTWLGIRKNIYIVLFAMYVNINLRHEIYELGVCTGRLSSGSLPNHPPNRHNQFSNSFVHFRPTSSSKSTNQNYLVSRLVWSISTSNKKNGEKRLEV